MIDPTTSNNPIADLSREISRLDNLSADRLERIKNDMKERRDIRYALVELVNDYDMDLQPGKTFSTHTGSYTEVQMIEMIRTWLEASVALGDVRTSEKE